MTFVKEYQRFRGLKPDGIIGRITFGMLMNDLGTSELETAHFLGQCSHESAGFTVGRENLNYSEAGLRATFRRYFKDAEFAQFQRNPEKIANRVYANRMGNADESSGEGWYYRGVGAIQLTGKDNIQAYFKYAGLPLNSNPEIILQPEHYFNSAKFFFHINDLWQYVPDVLKLSKAINLGNANSKHTPNGFLDRLNKTNDFLILIR